MNASTSNTFRSGAFSLVSAICVMVSNPQNVRAITDPALRIHILHASAGLHWADSYPARTLTGGASWECFIWIHFGFILLQEVKQFNSSSSCGGWIAKCVIQAHALLQVLNSAKNRRTSGWARRETCTCFVWVPFRDTKYLLLSCFYDTLWDLICATDIVAQNVGFWRLVMIRVGGDSIVECWW